MADIVFGDSQVTGRKTNEQIADEVWAGKWGNGDERKRRLTDAGYDYEAVQQLIPSRNPELLAQQQAPAQNQSVNVQQDAVSVPAQQDISGAPPQQTAEEQLSPDEITANRLQGIAERQKLREQERLANRQLYGISMPDEDYRKWNEVIANSDNPDEESARLGAAYKWSSILGESPFDCYMNLDALNAEWFGDKVTDYKSGFKAISDMITLGNNNVKIGILGNQIRDAHLAGNTELEEAYWNQYRALQAVNEDLQDSVPRGWLVEMLKAGAPSFAFSGYSALSGLFGNFIYPGVGTLAAFKTSSFLTRGQEYIDLIENGSDPYTANIVSVLSGGLQGFVEISLGSIASALAGSARIAGKTAATLTGNVAKNIANKLGKTLHFGPLAKVITNMGLRYAGNIAEEGAEEVVQYFISLAGQELAAALDGYDLPDDDIRTVVSTAMEEFKGGVMGAVVLGVAADSFNAAADISEYKRVGRLAGMVDSKEFFRSAVKDSPIFEGMSDQKKNSVIDEIHGAAQSKRDAAAAQQVNEIKEVNRAAEGFEDIEVDEETGESNARPVYRTAEGKLYTEDNTLRDTDSGEVRRYKAGDYEGDLDKNLYGYIDYEVDEQNKQIYIRDFIMNAGRENLRQELYDDFARESAGYEIIWEPDGSRAKAIKESLIRNNPQGVKAGLTYYDDAKTVMESDVEAAARRKVAEAVARYMPNVKRQGHLAAAVSLLEQMARSQGKKLSEYINKTFGSDIFGDTADVESEANRNNMTFELSQDEAKEKGYQVAAGATKWKDYENDLRAVIYAGQSADFSTWAHELAHIYRKQLSGDRLAEVEKAFGVVKGDWIHSAIRDADGNLMSSEEAFAYGFQDWLKTGNAPTAEMKNVFQKFAEFLARCFNALEKHIDLNQDIENVYKQMLSGGDSVLAQAERAVAEADRKMRAEAQEKRREQAAAAENTKNTETRAETAQDTSRQTGAAGSAEINPDELNLTPEDKAFLDRAEKVERRLSELSDKLMRESRADEDNEFPLDRNEAREIASEQVASEERMHYIVQDVKDAAGNGSFAREQQTVLNDNDTTQDMVNDVITDTAGKSFDVSKYSMDVNDIPQDMFYQTAEQRAELAETERQIEAVRSQYENTDQWMKAPNGEPTKLTERQWLLVRTPNFKRWFGNWLYDENKKVKITEMNLLNLPFDYADVKNLKQWLSDNLIGESVTIESDGQIVLFNSRTTKASIKRRGEQQRGAYSVLKELVKNSEFYTFEKVDAQKKHSHLKGQDVYYSALKVGEKYYSVKIKVDISKDNLEGAYKDHKVSEINIAPNLYHSQSEDLYADIGANDISLGSLLNFVKSEDVPNVFDDYSKVLDENGEPLVVYHGSNHWFTVFNEGETNKTNVNTPAGTIFTNDNKEIASSFENYYGGKIKDVILDKDSPLHRKYDWGVYRDGGVYSLFMNLRNPKIMDYDGKRWNQEGMNINEEVAKAKQEGYDGFIAKNIIDVGFTDTTPPASNDYIAFNNTDVKSATDNNGNFDANNPNILYQIAGEIGARKLDNNEEVAEGATRMQNLAVAKQMETDGKDAKAIRLATGWERGADGKWRYEMPDANARTDTAQGMILWDSEHPEFVQLLERMNNGEYKNFTDEEKETFKKVYKERFNDAKINQDFIEQFTSAGIPAPFNLPAVLDYPELYKAYPELKDVVVEIVRKKGTASGAFADNVKTIRLYKTFEESEEEMKSVLLHEIQHAIQYIEGFSTGGNMGMFQRESGPSELDRALAMYRNLTKDELKDFTKEKENQKFKDIGMSDEDIESVSIKVPGFGTSEDIIERGVRDHGADWMYDEIQEAAKRVDNEGKIVVNGKTYNSEYDAYRAIAGEVEARNVQTRLKFTPEERLNTLLAATEDVAPQDKIILFQTVYYGSGANFDRFDTESYGLSGEGSMYFGYGTYVTDNEEIAREYANRATRKNDVIFSDELYKDIHKALLTHYPDLDEFTDRTRIQNEIAEDIDGYLGLAQISEEEKKSIKQRIEKELETQPYHNLYTVEIPDDGYLEWEKTIDKHNLFKISEALYKKILELDEDELYKGAEKELKEELNSVFESETDGKHLYGTITDYLGSEQSASQFLSSLGYAGIKYPAGTILGNGNGAYNYVIFNDDDARIVDHLLFQTQQELYDDASLYDSWQDFMEAYESGFDPYAMESDDYHSQVPAGADAQWYKTTWELAHGLKPEESLDAEAVLEKYNSISEQPQNVLDTYFWMKMEKPGELENFLKRVQQILDTDLSGEEWRGITAEDAAARSEIDEMQKFIRTQLKHGTWLSNAMRVAEGKELTPRTRKTMLSLISHSLRDYRAIYSQIMGDEYFAVPEGDTVSGQLRSNVLADPDEDFEEMSPERRRQIAEDISNEDVARRIRSGELRLDGELDGYIKSIKKDLRETEKKYTDLKNEVDEDFRRIADAEQRELLRLHDKLLEIKARWHNRSDTTGRRIERALKTTGRYELDSQTLRADYDRIFRQYSDLKNVTRITAQVSEAMRHQKELYSLREALRQKQQDGRALENLKKLRTQLVKRTMRRVPFERIDYDSARLLIAIQRVFEPNLMGGVNEWIGQGSADARQVASAWLTDVDEKEKIEKYLKRKPGKLAGEMLEKLSALNTIEDFNKWSSKDKKRLARVMPKEDWVRELRLQELSKEREQSIDLDIKVDEVTRIVRNPSTGKNEDETRWVIRMPDELAAQIKDAVGADLYDDLMHRPFREWATEDLEKLAARVNEIYKDGRDTLAAKKQLRNEQAREIRKRIEALARDSGIQFDDGDTPEERAKKQDKIHKILGLDSDIKGTAAVKKDTRLNRLLNGYADANVRRVARILDNYTDGINTQMLYWREDECWNAREAAKERRAKAIKQVMADNKLTEVELSRIVEVDGLKFSVDDLLYVYAADKDYEVVRDDKGNPVLDEDGREINDDYAPTSRNAVMFGNMLSADEDVARKQEWEEMDRELAEAIAGETLDAEQMQELTAGILDRHPGQTLFMEKCRRRYNRVLRAATELIEGSAGLKALYETVAEDYAAEFERMNRVSVEEFNQPVNRIRNYVPMVRLESNGETNANQVKQDLLTTSGGNAAGKTGVNRGMTQRRVAISPLHQKPVQMGLYKTWLSSVDRTEHFIAYAPYVRELNRVYKGRDADYTRRFIENRYGRGMLSYIDDYINEVANPNANRVRTAGDDLMRTLRGKTAPAYLAWKLSGILKQAATSPAPYFQFVSPAEYAAAGWQCVTNHGWDLIKEKSLFMRNRVQDPLYDLVDELAEKADTPLKQKLMKLEKKGMSGLEFIDWACVAPGWLACYKKEYARLAQENEGAYDRKKAELEAEQRNITPESPDAVLTAEQIEKAAQDAVLTEADIEAAAVRYADDCTRQCQPSSRLSDLAPLYKNSSEFAKAYLQFQTSLNVIWQNIRYDLPAAVRTKQFKRAAGMIAGYAVAGIAMNMLMEGVTAGSGRKDDDDEKRLNALRNIIFYGTTQFTDSVPLIGSYLTTVVQKTLTGRSTYLSTGTDMTPMITKLGSAVMSVSNGNWAKAAGQFGEGVGLALGLPTSGIKEIYKFFTDEDGNFNVGFSTIYGLAKDITGGKGSSKK